MFVPFPLQIQRNQAGYTCITKALPIPSSKSEIQQISVSTWPLTTIYQAQISLVFLGSLWFFFPPKTLNLQKKKKKEFSASFFKASDYFFVLFTQWKKRLIPAGNPNTDRTPLSLSKRFTISHGSTVVFLCYLSKVESSVMWGYKVCILIHIYVTSASVYCALKQQSSRFGRAERFLCPAGARIYVLQPVLF